MRGDNTHLEDMREKKKLLCIRKKETQGKSPGKTGERYLGGNWEEGAQSERKPSTLLTDLGRAEIGASGLRLQS